MTEEETLERDEVARGNRELLLQLIREECPHVLHKRLNEGL
jgi:hypothetical protein